MRFEFEGDPEVLRNVVLQAEFVRTGNKHADDLNPTLYVGPGVQRSVMGAGHGRAMERRGLISAFKVMVGCSGGFASTIFGPGGQIEKQIDTYWTEAASKQFFDLKRLVTRKPIEDTKFLCDAFRQRLNLKAFHASPIEVWACVTCANTGEGRLLDAKDPRHHPADYVQASISIPSLCAGPVLIHGHPYYDGAGAMPMPTREIIERFRPTDLLIFPNCSKRDKDTMMSRIAAKMGTMGQSPIIQATFMTSDARRRDGIEYLRSQKEVRWAIIWGEGIGTFESNPVKLENAAREADEFFEDLLQQHAFA